MRYRAVAVTADALTYFYVDPMSGEVKRTTNARPSTRSSWRVSAAVNMGAYSSVVQVHFKSHDFVYIYLLHDGQLGWLIPTWAVCACLFHHNCHSVS